MSQNVAQFNKSFYITTLRLAFSSKLQHVKFCKYLLQLILNSINTKLYLFYLQGNNHIVYYLQLCQYNECNIKHYEWQKSSDECVGNHNITTAKEAIH